MMITLISLHNSSLSTEIAITVNQRVNLRLTEDTVTSCTNATSFPLALHPHVDIFHVNNSLFTCPGYYSLARIALRNTKRFFLNGLRSTILQNTNTTFCLLTFFFLLGSQAHLSKTGGDKDVPFNSWVGTRSSQLHVNKWRLL